MLLHSLLVVSVVTENSLIGSTYTVGLTKQTATEPMNTGFAAVLSFINCQRWDYSTFLLGFQQLINDILIL